MWNVFNFQGGDIYCEFYAAGFDRQTPLFLRQ